VTLLAAGRLSPHALPSERAIDLGCGTGENVLLLAENGFDAVGVDFSEAAIARAREAASARSLSDRARFVVGDVTATAIDGVESTFGLVVAYNTLQDLLGTARVAMAATVTRLTEPGSAVVLWCYYGASKDLPLLSFQGPSRLFPFSVRPGEEKDLFGQAFDIERLPEPRPETHTACFLLTRRT
jgi:SAM-dependent methyltransferase